ncbi:efflux RND transporter permease subunit [Zoogloea sp.]|uniref:efflux RND transporter permease subunit n=1 Tax=Zoogloea sp. TaxID=49181 RepID=UPI00141596AD|nr:MAG: efflux RND transporter permease subunit [Zoogloea sp.]
MSLSSISISRPVTTTMFYLGVVFIGLITFPSIAVDFLPPITIPRLTVQTLYPNVSSKEIEISVTQPLESSLSTVAGVKKISSISKTGLSIVTIEFDWSTKMDFATLNVREKLDQLRPFLPKEASRSTIQKADPSTEPIVVLGVYNKRKNTSPKHSADSTSTPSNLIELKEIAKALLKRRIEQIEGVAQVSVLGGDEREILVRANRDKMQLLNVSIDEICQALTRANINLPGGTLRIGMAQYPLRTLGEFSSIDQIKSVIINTNASGRLIRVSDIGDVVDTVKERIGFARYNGEEIISLEIRKEAGSNTVLTSKKIHQVIQQIQLEYPLLNVVILSNQAEYINQSVDDILQAIIIGSILAFLVLFIFLKNPKYPLIVGLTIPISIVGTFVVMYFSNITLNVMSLTGLALGIGMLGDNAIIVVENVTRLREKGMGLVDAALNGAREINIAVTASTFTNVAIYLPIIFVEGVGRQMFGDMGLTMTVSLVVSLIVAITLVPMLVSRSIDFFPVETSRIASTINQNFDVSSPRHKMSNQQKKLARRWFRRIENYLSRKVGRLKMFIRYIVLRLHTIVDNMSEHAYHMLDQYLLWGIDNKKVVVVALLFVFILSLGAAYYIPSESAPDLDNSRFVISIKMPTGTTLEGLSQITKTIEDDIKRTNGVDGIYSMVGIVDDISIWSVSNSSMESIKIEVNVQKENNSNTVIESIREKLSLFQNSYNGLEYTIKKKGTSIEQILRPENNDIKLRVVGSDMKIASDLARKISSRIKEIKGVADLQTNLQNGSPEYVLVVDRNRANYYGLTVQQIAKWVSDQVKGREASEYSEFDRKIVIRVSTNSNGRQSINELMSSYINIGNGSIPLRELVNIESLVSNDEIWRENQQSAAVITANINGRSLNSVLGDINTVISEFPFPSGYTVLVGGENEEIKNSFKGLMIVIVLSIFIVYMILAAEYESVLYPLVILLTSPMAIIGSILAMIITGQNFNIMSLIGIVIMIGAVDNDAVIAVDIISMLRKQGKDLKNAIIIGMKQRLRPILITTVTTILGMIPLVFEFGTGSELVRALTIPLIGGMISSTFFTVVAIPIIYIYVDNIVWSRNK